MYALAALTMILPACSKTVSVAPVSLLPESAQQQQPTPVERRVYHVRGMVRSVDGAGKSITVEHEDIRGFMPSMTMPFEAKDSREIAHITPGTAIEFQLILVDTDSWIEGVKPINAASLHLPQPDKPVEGTSKNAPRLQEGDRIPAFHLVDHANQAITNASLEGKTTILTFIFTRCPLPNFCPAMSRDFASLQEKIAANPMLAGHVQLLSISFDPEDNPQLMAQYATAFTHDTGNWHFLSGTKAETEKLTHAFSVYVRAENGTISHGLCTALVGPNGTIEKIWRGNDWDVNEVLASAASIQQPGRVASAPKR